MPIDSTGRWYNAPDTRSDAELASAARAAGSSTSTPFDVQAAEKLVGTLQITNANGGTVTAGLDITYDGTNWDDAGAWPAKSANGTHRRGFDVRGATQARWRWTVATATVTFNVNTVEAARGR